MVFPFQAQKEVFAQQLITALRVVQAQCPAQLGPTLTSQASQCVPAALLATTAQKRLATSQCSPVPLDSTALMVDSPKTQSFVVVFLHKCIEKLWYSANSA